MFLKEQNGSPTSNASWVAGSTSASSGWLAFLKTKRIPKVWMVWIKRKNWREFTSEHDFSVIFLFWSRDFNLSKKRNMILFDLAGEYLIVLEPSIFALNMDRPFFQHIVRMNEPGGPSFGIPRGGIVNQHQTRGTTENHAEWTWTTWLERIPQDVCGPTQALEVVSQSQRLDPKPLRRAVGRCCSATPGGTRKISWWGT